MSLFKAREWWTASTGSDEEFSPSAFCVADLDNQGGNKVATGSLSGLLRIYQPRQRDYRAEDLLLEQRLDAPVIQLATGLLLPGGTRLALAVLHPRKLVVYEVHAGKQLGAYHSLAKVQEHALDRNTFNMAIGRFGSASQARAVDSIAVQSIDGTVSVFEGDALAFSRLLANSLIPGPWVHSPRADCFFTANSALEVCCYKLSSLTLAQASSESGSGAGAQRKVNADWSTVVGEHVVDIKLGRFTSNPPTSESELIVLGAQTLFVLKEAGAIRYQRRLDMQPSCLCVYSAGEGADTSTGGSDNVLIASATGALLVLREGVSLWSARCDQPPIALSVGTFADVKGMLVSLTERGVTSVLYLGTDPPTTAVGGSHEKDLDYDEMDDEHRRLLGRIREATGGNRAEPTDYLTLRAQVPKTVDPVAERGLGDDDRSSAGPSVTVRVSVAYSGKGPLESVQLLAQCEPPFFCLRESVELSAVQGGSGTPLSVPLVFRCAKDMLPASCKALVVATYTTADGAPRTARAEFDLPLAMVCKVIAPVKNGTYKVTLDTDQPPAQIGELFGDLLALAPGAEAGKAGASVLSLQLASGHDVTVLLSKNAGRYRIQSGSFEPMWQVAHELQQRLRKALPGVNVSFNEPLPLQEYFELIDVHFAARQELAETQAALEQRAQQFRVVQKRLLVRFKDKNPAPLANLDLLLGGTYEQLMELGSKGEAAKKALALATTSLACGTQLINQLIALRFELDEDNAAELRSHLSPQVHDFSEQGWEERTDAALALALRTSLGKAAAKDAAGASLALPPLAMPIDVSKLKKHITVVCDRLSKGGRFK
mmetsp:Transcript_25283/g.64255  ORF Transcript_25283/g.64255 Transcript_25283/m.64255 type:complete len:826 (-) Transcript_25283:98-2575(-)